MSYFRAALPIGHREVWQTPTILPANSNLDHQPSRVVKSRGHHFIESRLVDLFAADNSDAVAISPAMNPRQRDIFLKIPLKDQKAAPIHIADAGARPDGVRLTTSWPTPTMNQGETIVNTLDV
jgi:hypothetical protein